MNVKPIVIWLKDKLLDIPGKKTRLKAKLLFVLSIGTDFIPMNIQVTL